MIGGVAAGLLSQVATKVINNIPDPTLRIQAQKDFAEGMLKAAEGQVAINLEEAKHPSIFVAGWRPFMGWACGFLVIAQVLYIDQWIALQLGLNVTPNSYVFEALFGMLGLGGWRSWEKYQGVARNRVYPVKYTNSIQEQIRNIRGRK